MPPASPGDRVSEHRLLVGEPEQGVHEAAVAYYTFGEAPAAGRVAIGGQAPREQQSTIRSR